MTALGAALLGLATLLASACAGKGPARGDGRPPAVDIAFRDSSQLADLSIDGASDADAVAGDAPNSAGLPGSGPVRALASAALAGGVLQILWRGAQGYTRSVPFDAANKPDWSNASPWSPTLQPGDLPGQADVQSMALTVVQSQLSHGVWRGDQGFSRSIPLAADGSADFTNASSWAGPIALTEFPGSGSLAAQTSFIASGQLHQSFWRGSERFARRVPLLGDGAPDWANAEAWLSRAETMPGSGAVQAEDIFSLPDGQLVQTIWRGDARYRRSGPPDSAQPASLDASQSSSWDGPTAP